MSGPHAAPAHGPMCDRCSTRWTVRLEVDTRHPSGGAAGDLPVHHVTVMFVCDEHITAGVAVLLGALNARPGRHPELWRMADDPPPPA